MSFLPAPTTALTATQTTLWCAARSDCNLKRCTASRTYARETKACNMDVDGWEELARNHTIWMQEVRRGLKRGKEKLHEMAEERHRHRKSNQCRDRSESSFICTTCSRDCHSRVGLYSHSRRCSNPNASCQFFNGFPDLSTTLIFTFVFLISSSYLFFNSESRVAGINTMILNPPFLYNCFSFFSSVLYTLLSSSS